MEKLPKATIYYSFLNTTHLVKTPFIPYRHIHTWAHTHQIQRIMLLEHVKGALAFKVFVFPKRQKPVTFSKPGNRSQKHNRIPTVFQNKYN